METASGRALSPKQVDAMTGLSRTTRWRLENEGDFPKRRKLSKRRVFYLEGEITVWLKSRETVDVGNRA